MTPHHALTGIPLAPRSFPHGYGFDPACGMDLEQLLAVAPPEPPADFAAFWQARFNAAMAIAPQPQLRATGEVRGEHKVFDLRYISTGSIEIGGWLLAPQDGPVIRGLVIGHGYGGRDAPDELLPIKNAVYLYPCFRGLGRSARAGISPDPFYHVLHDIQDRDRYLIGGCVADLWLAVSALLELFPQVSGNISCLGISFGGGIGVLATPWDARIGRLCVEVPTFGHQALRLILPCTGSGEAVRAFQRQHRLNVMETLAYYDAAAAARFLRIPTLVAAAEFDPAVPPPGQFAVYNAIAPSLRQLFVLNAGHFDYPNKEEQYRELTRAVAAFLAAL